MADGRTYWHAKDAAWWRREWIVALGEEFGSAGPAVIDWLECEAKAQNDAGRVKAGPRTVARGSFVDVVTVGHVLSRSVTLGLLVDYVERAGRFECRIVWFVADQVRAQAASRKNRQRNGATANTETSEPLSRSVTVGHGESRSVTKCPTTGQDSINERPKGLSRSAAERAEHENGKASDDDKANCRLFAERLLSHNPKAKIPKAGTGSHAEWLRSMRLLREHDGNGADEIARLIRWLFDSGDKGALFWADTLKAPSGLREHFPQLWAKHLAADRPVLAAVPHVETSAEYLARTGQS
jgi:hypothetical protein